MRVLLIGCGGHASDVLGVFEALARHTGAAHSVIGWVADGDDDGHRLRQRGLHRLGDLGDIARIDASHYVLGIGYSQPRELVDRRVSESGLTPVTAVHPQADVPPGTALGPGTIVCSGARVGPLVRMGRHVCLAAGSIVGHDCAVSDYATVLPGGTVSGDTFLGQACLIGSNATILQGLRIGARAVVGAGAVVLRDVAPGAVVVGNPARPLER